MEAGIHFILRVGDQYMGFRMLGKEMELCLANAQINVKCVSGHIQRLKLLYLLAFCWIEGRCVWQHVHASTLNQHQSAPSSKED